MYKILCTVINTSECPPPKNSFSKTIVLNKRICPTTFIHTHNECICAIKSNLSKEQKDPIYIKRGEATKKLEVNRIIQLFSMPQMCSTQN